MSEHPERRCHRCGAEFQHWIAPSPLWNEAMRGGNINNPELFDGIVCMTCFTFIARMIADDWVLRPRQVFVPLQTTTPSGRVWNDETMLWEALPHPAQEQQT